MTPVWPPVTALAARGAQTTVCALSFSRPALWLGTCLFGRQGGRAPTVTALGMGVFETSAGAFTQGVAFPFGQRGQDGYDEFAGRRGGVEVEVAGGDTDTARVEVTHRFQRIDRGASQPVQAGHGQHVAGT